MSDPRPPKNPLVERGGPSPFTTVRTCEWCGSEPLADTDYCENCDMVRDNWLEVRYAIIDGTPAGHIAYVHPNALSSEQMGDPSNPHSDLDARVLVLDRGAVR